MRRSHLRRAACGACLLSASFLVATAGLAQTPAVELERVTVTGSNIPSVHGETALSVQVITREEIARSGVTTVEQLLERVPSNLNGINLALSIGDIGRPGLSSANLRGLGGGSTLVLLNGRRLANYALDGESVDLNTIPLAAIERVEVLRDGASAIYGTDAIAGVINFILRKNYRGAEIAASVDIPQHTGGDSWQASAAYGVGDPARDGYNVFVVANVQRSQALRAIDRDFARTAYRPDLGVNNLSAITFPSNIVDFPNRRFLNPTLDAGCDPPASLPAPVGPRGTTACGFDYATEIDLLPEVKRASVFARGAWRAGADVDVFAEALVARNQIDTQIAPNALPSTSPFGLLLYPDGGPYYPTAFAAANGLSGDLQIVYRALELGSRVNSTDSDAQRYVIGAEGVAAGWDYNVAAVYSFNEEAIGYSGSWVYLSRIIPAMYTGVINPWGPSTPEGMALLASTAYSGTPQTADASTTLVNAIATREVATLPAGPLALALGAEARRERLSYDWDPAVLSGDSPVGSELQSISGDRDVLALYAEASVPIARGLEAQLAVRHDDYSDFGSTTNPKIALRWQPVRSLLLRGSWGEGFRAPPLYALYEPVRREFATFEDPVRCPVTGSLGDCIGFAELYIGGNPGLQPQTSTQWSAGSVWEPARGLSFTVDYWNIEQTGVFGMPDVDTMLQHPEAFPGRVVRGPVDPEFPSLPGPIVALDVTWMNVGTTQTSGFDVAFNWAAPPLACGTFRLSLQGTYVTQWETQIDGVNTVSNLGSSVHGTPVPRWRSAVTVDWTRGPWGATLTQLYSSGYVEALSEPAVGTREVGATSTWDLQGRYEGFKGWQIAAGIRNLLDTDPPVSGQLNTFQIGYNPQIASPLGRTFYLRAGYTFR